MPSTPRILLSALTAAALLGTVPAGVAHAAVSETQDCLTTSTLARAVAQGAVLQVAVGSDCDSLHADAGMYESILVDGVPVSAGTTVTVLPGNIVSYTAPAITQLNRTEFTLESTVGGTAATYAITTSAVVPSAPGGVTAEADGLAVGLAWDEPAHDGGADITDYLVEYSSNNGTTWVSYSDGPGTDLATSLSNLTAGTAYVFRVAAVNALGTSPWSSTSAPATPVAPTVPGTPTLVTVTPSETTFTVAWTLASDGGSAITDFQVGYSANAGSTWTVWAHTASAATSATITGLTAGTSYMFRVAAVNAVGQGAWSTATAATKLSTVLAAPAGVTATVKGADVVLAWTSEPAGATDYKIEYSTDKQVTWKTWTHTPFTGKTVTVTGLTPATGYAFRVSAVTATSTSTPSTVVTVTTPATVGDPVPGPEVQTGAPAGPGVSKAPKGAVPVVVAAVKPARTTAGAPTVSLPVGGTYTMPVTLGKGKKRTAVMSVQVDGTWTRLGAAKVARSGKAVSPAVIANTVGEYLLKVTVGKKSVYVTLVVF